MINKGCEEAKYPLIVMLPMREEVIVLTVIVDKRSAGLK